MKVCKGCSEEKPLTEYYKNKNDIYQARCKPCFKKKGLENSKKGKYWKKQNSKPCAVKARRKWNIKYQGVYGIFSGETCLYVGESKQVNKRICDHKSYIKNPSSQPGHKELYNLISQHKDIIFKILEETPNHKEQERIWINKLNPLYNKRY